MIWYAAYDACHVFDQRQGLDKTAMDLQVQAAKPIFGP
jgi:hypothetical protein